MSWDIDVSEKLYQRLANEIFFRILHGKYRTGDKMPSYTELAKEAGSSPETVRKAFRELQHYGVIEKMRRGYFVTADEAVVMAYRQQYLALLGSYMICREDQDDTAKSLHLIPVSKAKLTAAKMIVTFVFSILIYLLLFITTFSAEAVLHFSGLSVKMVLRSLKMYLLEGAGVFLAVSPIIAIVPYMKKSYWLAMLLAEIYSFAGLFMSMPLRYNNDKRKKP